MDKHTSTPQQSLILQGKDRYFKAQLERVYQAFFTSPKTMKEVDILIGIMRENICWYCRTLRKQNRLFAVKKRRCSVTKYPNVTEWTTNPDLVPPTPQLSLEFSYSNRKE